MAFISLDGGLSGIGLNSSLKWLISAPKRLSSHHMMTFLKKGSVTADNSTLHITHYLTDSLQIYIQSLTTASGSRLFGSVVKHWIIDPAARVRFPPK